MTMTTVNAQGKIVTKSMKKYSAILESGHIEERDIIAMRSFMHKNKDNADFIFDCLRDREPLTLSQEQNQKGYDFLMNCWKTPAGKERKNNPFGYREQNILENFSHFELDSLYDAGNYNHNFYLPLYNCVSKDGDSFQYYYNGKVNIIG